MKVQELSELKVTCAAMPAQWEGMTIDGKAVYVRYRFGSLCVGVGDDPTGADYGNYYDEYYGKSMDGDMSTAKMLELTGLRLSPGVSCSGKTFDD
jgi:hypothetical protein